MNREEANNLFHELLLKRYEHVSMDMNPHGDYSVTARGRKLPELKFEFEASFTDPELYKSGLFSFGVAESTKYNHKFEPLEETKMNKEQAEELLKQLKKDGYAASHQVGVHDPEQKYEVLIERKLSQCERCYFHIPDDNTANCTEDMPTPSEGINCSKFTRYLVKIGLALLDEHLDLFINQFCNGQTPHVDINADEAECYQIEYNGRLLFELHNELKVKKLMLKNVKQALMTYHENRSNTYQVIREFGQVLIDGIITDHPEVNHKHTHLE